MIEQARIGYRWMRVCTPQVFEEYEIPLGEPMTAKERRNYERLQHLAEAHRTSILCAYTRVG